MTIEEANIEDYEILTDIMRRSKAIWGYEKEQLKKWKKELTISKEYIANNVTFKLCQHNKIIGFYSQINQGQHLKLDNLFIAPEYIGEGFGGIMLKHFIERAKLISNNKIIILESDPNAEKFYQKHNFKTIGLQETSISNRFMPIMMLSKSNLEDIKLFDSKRLFVRHLREGDIEGFYKMQSNPNVMKYIKPPMNYEESKEELNRFISYYKERKLLFRIWALIEKRTGNFVGICGVYLNENCEFEIAYRLQESNWGKGLGKEIAEKLIDFCFETFDYERLFAYVMEENIGSKKILDKIMNYKGEVKSKENLSKSFIYEIEKENWLQQCI